MRREWNIFIRREENPRSERRPEPMTSSPILSFPFSFFFLFFFSPSYFRQLSLPCRMRQADWNQHSVRAVISQRDIKHAGTSISNRPLTALRRWRRWGGMRGRLGLWGDAVSSSGFAETPPRQDKVYQVIAQFKLLLGQQGIWEAVCQMISACVRVISCVRVCVCGWACAGVWHLGKESAASLSCKLILIRGKIKMCFTPRLLNVYKEIWKLFPFFSLCGDISLWNKVDGVLVIAQGWRPRDDLGFSQCFYSTNGR